MTWPMNEAAMIEQSTASLEANGDEAMYEVVNGQRVELPPMGIYTVWIASLLQRHMGLFADSHGLGIVVIEGLFILDAVKNIRRRPDVAFVSKERWPVERPLPEEGDWEVIPDLVVEVVSPNDTFKDVFPKLCEYFAFGVRQAWLVLPSVRQIHVYDGPTKVRILAATDELGGDPHLPGFRVPVADLFRR